MEARIFLAVTTHDILQAAKQLLSQTDLLTIEQHFITFVVFEPSQCEYTCTSTQ